jgi:hypothetical protein
LDGRRLASDLCALVVVVVVLVLDSFIANQMALSSGWTASANRAPLPEAEAEKKIENVNENDDKNDYGIA